MKVLVLYNEPDPHAAIEEQDVLAQRDAVLAALARRGHEATSYGCTLDLNALRRFLSSNRPDVVFNLVEALGGTDRLMSLPILLLDALEIPCTGAPALSILETSDKLRAKRKLRDSGLPTPAWVESRRSKVTGDGRADRWIIKPVGEHASVGMDDDAVVQVDDLQALRDLCQQRSRQQGRILFAEQFIEGREFNLSILAGEVLPPAEIDFTAFPAGKPRIVGHKAKWDQESFEYNQTPRRFEFDREDAELLEQLTALALRCWDLFELNGFARVDFRVDTERAPWILEVNVNPCLSPDAGFAAALDRGQVSYDDAVERILQDTLVPGLVRATRH